MRPILRFMIATSAFTAASVSVAQTAPTKSVPACLQYQATGLTIPCTGVVPVDANGNPILWTDLFKNITVTSSGGGSSGSSGDASASNQAIQITTEQLISQRLGDLINPASGSVNDRLNTLNTKLSGLLYVAPHAVSQSGAWVTSLSGLLPGYASTPTFNLGTAPTLTVTNTGLFPVQFAGSLPTGSNTIGAVTQSGIWNIAVSNLPTVASGAVATTTLAVQNADGTKLASDTNAAASVAQLTNVNTKLNTVITNLGTPLQAGGAVTLSGTPTVNIGTMPAITANVSSLSISSLSLTDSAAHIGLINNTSFGATQSGTWNVGITGTPTIANTSFASTQSGLWSVGITNLPTAPSGSISTTGMAVQNLDGTKIASDTNITAAVAQLTQANSKLSSLITALGTPLQAGGTVSLSSVPAHAITNTSFGVSSLPALPTGSNTIGNVNVNGTVPVSGTFYPAVQAVSQSGTWSINATNPSVGTFSTANTNATSIQNSDGTKLASDTNAAASVTQLTQAVSKLTSIVTSLQGTLAVQMTSLPSYASTPTFNLGTAPSLVVGSSVLPTGAAKDSSLGSILSTLQGTLFVDTVSRLANTNRALTAGTSSLVLMPANLGRHGYKIQVQSTTETCYVNDLGAATADNASMQIGPGGYYVSDVHHVETGAIFIMCTAPSVPVYAREW